jgi:membrane-associated phospholipid phosphatase
MCRGPRRPHRGWHETGVPPALRRLREDVSRARPTGPEKTVTAAPETARLATKPVRGLQLRGRLVEMALRLQREVSIVLAGVLLYFGGRGLTESDPAPAMDHAQDLVAFERALGVFWEPWLQGLVDGSHALVTAANWVYIWGHWPVIALTLVWLVVRHPATYRRTRNAMAASGAIGMAVFVLYPVAPPRLVDLGLVDTVSQHSEAYRVLQPPAFTNIYAALPSLHVGWNLLMGIAIATAARHWLLRAVGYALPLLMAAAVVLTANHYLVDVVAGAAVALTGLALARRLERLAPRPTARPTASSERRVLRPG